MSRRKRIVSWMLAHVDDGVDTVPTDEYYEAVHVDGRAVGFIDYSKYQGRYYFHKLINLRNIDEELNKKLDMLDWKSESDIEWLHDGLSEWLGEVEQVKFARYVEFKWLDADDKKSDRYDWRHQIVVLVEGAAIGYILNDANGNGYIFEAAENTDADFYSSYFQISLNQLNKTTNLSIQVLQRIIENMLDWRLDPKETVPSPNL